MTAKDTCSSASAAGEPRRELVPVGHVEVGGAAFSAVHDPTTRRVTICAGAGERTAAQWLGGIDVRDGELVVGPALRAELRRRRVPVDALLERVTALLVKQGMLACTRCGSPLHAAIAHGDARAAVLAAEAHRRAGDTIGAQLFVGVATTLRERQARACVVQEPAGRQRGREPIQLGKQLGDLVALVGGRRDG